MEPSQTEVWLDHNLPKYNRLTQVVTAILENIIQSNGIDYLAISGRTKDKKSALEKIKRKGYEKPSIQLTDLSGIRVIVFFESDVDRVSQLIAQAFSIDKKNSLNKDDLLSINQIGYRSVHFVCDIGKRRGALPEFNGLGSMRFEVQVRTVLQHAWAELAHDRNYKFSGKLPHAVERKMYLYAGMLEVADKGFDELSRQIDSYIEELSEKSNKGDLSSEINSISLEKFVTEWSARTGFELTEPYSKEKFSDLVNELTQFGLKTLADLKEIVPKNYVEVAKASRYSTSIYGLVRDWMLISDWRKFIRQVEFDWVIDTPNIFSASFSKEEFSEFSSAFKWLNGDLDYFEDLN